uniref:Uncharacterized protein n=1 Tax=Plectus sambesii TaxID=2011161 RepID=A0A914VCM8_9BILA
MVNYTVGTRISCVSIARYLLLRNKDDDVPTFPLSSAGPEKESDDDRAFTSENVAPQGMAATLPTTADSATDAAPTPPPRRSTRSTKGIPPSRYVP